MSAEQELKALKARLEAFIRDQQYYNDVESMRAVWQNDKEDNVDATHPLTVRFFIPEDCKVVDRGILRLSLLNFRSYGTGAASVAAHRHRMMVASSMSVPLNQTTGAAGGHDHNAEVTAEPDHTHSYQGLSAANVMGFDVLLNTEGPTFGVMGMYADFVGSGNNDVYTYDAAGEHVHDILHGIYEGTVADDVTVTINGTDRTVALGGPFTEDQDSLDIRQYLTTGWNTISVGSSRLGRINATYFVKAYLP